MKHTREDWKRSIKNPSLDRRVKLTREQKNDIRKRWFVHCFRVSHGFVGEGLSQRKLAKEYGVSRRLIIWTLYPDRLKQNIEQRNERGGSKQYYSKDKQRNYMRVHRAYKKVLLDKNLI